MDDNLPPSFSIKIYEDDRADGLAKWSSSSMANPTSGRQPDLTSTPFLLSLLYKYDVFVMLLKNGHQSP